MGVFKPWHRRDTSFQGRHLRTMHKLGYGRQLLHCFVRAARYSQESVDVRDHHRNGVATGSVICISGVGRGLGWLELEEDCVGSDQRVTERRLKIDGIQLVVGCIIFVRIL